LWLAAALASADTIVNTDIQSDTTWTSPGSPYVVTNNIAVHAGATLTIRPGVVVRFDPQTGMDVNGRLIAEGTKTNRIQFTSADTTPGTWAGINLIGDEAAPNLGSRLRYATIEYGGRYYANLYLVYARASVRDCTIRRSSADGIYGGYGGVADVEDTNFSGNVQSAVRFEDGSVDPLLARLTAAGNGSNSIRLGAGTLAGEAIWENCGLPYIIGGTTYVDHDSVLQVKPGVTVRFDQDTAMIALGRLLAIGTAAQPILFTGTQPNRGWWSGISIIGTPDVANAGSVLTHATVEYGGGYYGNLYVDEAQIAVSQCTIRESSADGIYLWYGGNASTVERSQIVNNAGYAIQHNNAVEPTNRLLAANNWWGHASGPFHATCNPTGTGGQISDGVTFRPYLTSPNQDPGPLAPADARILSLTPQRWFAPADDVTRIWVKITLRDGTGRALPGRTVTLQSTRGTVADGGPTDFRGESLASLTSNTPGDARLTAELQNVTDCEFAQSPSAAVTFGPFGGGSSLMPDPDSPYLSQYVEVTPLPLTRGVPTTLSATLTNPNAFPVSVNATFSFANYGIGQVFGDIATVLDRTIPANSTGTVKTSWTPVVSGHYCLYFAYSAQSLPGVIARAWTDQGGSFHNLQVYPGPLGPPEEKETIEKAEHMTLGIESGEFVLDAFTDPDQFSVMLVPRIGINRILDFNFKTWRKACEALGGDPPRLDYTLYAVPEHFTFTPIVAGPDLTAARAAAANALVEAALDLTSNLRAATLSLDRYGGAAAAGDVEWAARQAAALLAFKHDSGAAMVRVADRIDALLQVIRNEGTSEMVLLADTARAYQQRLRDQGFTAEEIQAARTINLTDAEIEAIRQERIAADPERMAGPLLARLANVAAAFRELGAVLQNPVNFGAQSSGDDGARAAAANNLVRVYETASSFALRNPRASSAIMELRVRRIDLPADWMVDVRPTSLTLAAGAQTTATISVRAGTAAVQGTRPRVAIEGFADGQFVGGIALDVLVPRHAYFERRARAAGWKLYR
jgi:hypothetical protein